MNIKKNLLLGCLCLNTKVKTEKNETRILS